MKKVKVILIPTQPTPQKQDLMALQEAVQKIKQLLETSGISEDELFADFQNAKNSTMQFHSIKQQNQTNNAPFLT